MRSLSLRLHLLLLSPALFQASSPLQASHHLQKDPLFVSVVASYGGPNAHHLSSCSPDSSYVCWEHYNKGDHTSTCWSTTYCVLQSNSRAGTDTLGNETGLAWDSKTRTGAPKLCSPGRLWVNPCSVVSCTAWISSKPAE